MSSLFSVHRIVCLIGMLLLLAGCRQSPQSSSSPSTRPESSPSPIDILFQHNGRSEGQQLIATSGSPMQIQALLSPVDKAELGDTRVIVRLLNDDPALSHLNDEQREMDYQGLWHDFGHSALMVRPMRVPTDRPGRYRFEVTVQNGQKQVVARRGVSIEVRGP